MRKGELSLFIRYMHGILLPPGQVVKGYRMIQK
jgi:hypothetical protein